MSATTRTLTQPGWQNSGRRTGRADDKRGTASSGCRSCATGRLKLAAPGVGNWPEGLRFLLSFLLRFTAAKQ